MRKVLLGLVALLVVAAGGVFWQVHRNMSGDPMMGSGMMGRGYGAPAAPKQYRAGEQVFNADCSGCHPNGGNSVQHDRPIINAPQLSDFDTFNRYIRRPTEPGGSPGLMPAFPESRISDRQSRVLYDYIVHVLQKP